MYIKHNFRRLTLFIMKNDDAGCSTWPAKHNEWLSVSVWYMRIDYSQLGAADNDVMQTRVLQKLLGELPHNKDTGWGCTSHHVSGVSMPHPSSGRADWATGQPGDGQEILAVRHKGTSTLATLNCKANLGKIIKRTFEYCPRVSQCRNVPWVF